MLASVPAPVQPTFESSELGGELTSGLDAGVDRQLALAARVALCRALSPESGSPSSPNASQPASMAAVAGDLEKFSLSGGAPKDSGPQVSGAVLPEQLGSEDVPALSLPSQHSDASMVTLPSIPLGDPSLGRPTGLPTPPPAKLLLTALKLSDNDLADALKAALRMRPWLGAPLRQALSDPAAGAAGQAQAVADSPEARAAIF